ncbi:autotransporter assembly complex protein TamA [Candidatus Erwinia haradaeae]|uniref:Translocation and assembly module subunit TamA n=1 Tax=Candidatus Erwinia haradaeae TaxID=1922217 RepID=A0A451D236_9GAMM|nr:autotransporter assembly complex family protein [Candidatus Erwinia haradaeae]VFP79678.1 Translocation and assembly module subunit TamA [Candidatus Erwinia haradaeae]
MPRIYIYLLFSVLIIFFTSHSEATQAKLQITGLPEKLKIDIQERLSTIIKNQMLIDIHVRSYINRTIKETLKALGYYEPKIFFTLLPPTNVRKYPLLSVKVIPGSLIKISEAVIILRGIARSDSDYLTLVQTGRPPIGSILHHEDYENFKNALNNISLRKGYFSAHYNVSELRVSITQHKAFWYIDYDSGPRYLFGPINFTGSQIQENFLHNLVPFKIGDVYSTRNLEELTRRLSATGWFNSVSIIPNINPIPLKNIIPLRGILTPRIKSSIEVGLGSATNVGPHLKARWKKNLANNKGHSFHIISNISVPEKNLKWTYKIPILINPLEKYYLLQGIFKHTHLNDTKSNASSLTLSQYWDYSNGWQWAAHLHWILDNFIQGNTINRATLIYPSLTLNRTSTCNMLMMPNWGNLQHYSVDVSRSLWGSYMNFLILQAHNTWIRTLTENHRFIARINLGWIITKQFEKIPPDMRFFAGGDHSIRGYKYKGLAPHDHTGKLTGASKLAISSIEYQYHIMGNWWVAVFVDSGAILLNTHQDNIHIGAGYGIRWHSPIGSIKLDFARPIFKNNINKIQFYISFGPEL